MLIKYFPKVKEAESMRSCLQERSPLSKASTSLMVHCSPSTYEAEARGLKFEASLRLSHKNQENKTKRSDSNKQLSNTGHGSNK